MSKIYNEYLRLKEINKEKMYLFKNGNFYIFLADDCDLINEYIVLKKVKFSSTYKCGFPINVLSNYMRVFNNHKLNIEIIEKIEDRSDGNVNEIIKNLNIDTITPIEALIKLKELKELVK